MVGEVSTVPPSLHADQRLQFAPISPEAMHMIVDKFVGEPSTQPWAKKVKIKVTKAGRDLLAKLGYDPAFGARPLARVIVQKLETPLTDEIALE